MALFDSSRFVWIDEDGKGRNVYALFRRTFELSHLPDSAFFHLFADTRYRLRVNGAILGYGPGRFVPERPEYDSYDVVPHLKPGTNTITVEVNSYGTTSAEAMSGGCGGFIATGEISSIDLGTPGNWKVRPVNDVWDAHAIKASFIQSAVEVCDTRKSDPSWFLPGFDDSEWAAPVVVSDQSHWGSLQKRTVPMYSDRVDTPDTIELLAGLSDDEERIGFRVFDASWDRYKKQVKNHFAYAIWLHSPRVQTCTIGAFWGPHYLNGIELRGDADSVRGNRENFSVALNKGWNLLYGEPEMVFEVWALIIGLPREAGLSAHAIPDVDCPYPAKYSDALSPEQLNTARQAIPSDQASLEAVTVDWHYAGNDGFSAHPARMIRWDRVQHIEGRGGAFPLECSLAKHRIWGITVDMGREFHGHLTLDIEAPKGSSVEVLFEEQKRPDGLAGRLHYEPADPADAYTLRGGRQQIEGFRSNGGRYIQLVVRGPEGSSEKVMIHQVGIRSAEIDVNMRGRFSCSDPVFNWAWEASKATFAVCQSDVYLPDVWRERGLAVADNRLSTFINRYLDADMRVSRRSVDFFRSGLGFFEEGILNPYMPSEAVGPHCEFSLIWPVWLEDHWNVTGDCSLVEDCLPTAENILNGSGWQAAASGLWNTKPYKPFVDWGATPEHQVADENTCLNALRIAAIDSVSRLRRIVSAAPGDADQWAAEANGLRQTFCDRLWLADEERFALGTLSGRPWAEPPAPHANLLALRFGMVPSGKEQSVLDYLEAFAATNLERCLQSQKHRRGTITLLFLHYLLEVFYDWNRPASAERILRDHWGYMKAQGAWTIWEKLTSELPSSQCHVWGATPIYHAGRNILGIRQARPADERAFIIEPSAEKLQWASGSYPLSKDPSQSIDVHWQVIEKDILKLCVQAPQGIDIHVLPRGRLAQLHLCSEIMRC